MVSSRWPHGYFACLRIELFKFEPAGTGTSCCVRDTLTVSLSAQGPVSRKTR